MNILNFAVGVASVTKGNNTSTSTSTGYRSTDTYESFAVATNDNTWIAQMEIPPTHHYLWLSYHLYDNDDAWDGGDTLYLRDENGQVWFRVNATTGEYYNFYFWNGMAWVILTRYGSTVRYTTGRWDIRYQPDGITVYLNGSIYAEYKGTIPKPTARLATVEFGAGLDTYSTHWSYYSAVFIADEDTRAVTMCQHTIDADGTHHTDFTGGDYTAVNGIATLGIAGALSGANPEDTQTFVVEDTKPNYTTGYNILAVGVMARAANNADDVVNNIVAVASDGVNTVESPAVPLDTVMSPRTAIMYNAPDGSAWDATKFNAAEFGIRAKA